MVVEPPRFLPPNNLVVGSLEASTNSQLEKDITSADKAKKNTKQAQHLNRQQKRYSSLQQSMQPQATLPSMLPGVQQRIKPTVRHPHQPTAQHQLGVSLPPLTSSNTQILSHGKSHSSRVSVPLPFPPLNTTRVTDHEDHSYQAPLSESLPPLSTSYVSTNADIDQRCPSELCSTVHIHLDELHLALQVKHLHIQQRRDKRILRRERDESFGHKLASGKVVDAKKKAANYHRKRRIVVRQSLLSAKEKEDEEEEEGETEEGASFESVN